MLVAFIFVENGNTGRLLATISVRASPLPNVLTIRIDERAATTLATTTIRAEASTTMQSCPHPFTCPGDSTCNTWTDGCNTCDCVNGCSQKFCKCYEDNTCVPKCLDNEQCVLAGIFSPVRIYPLLPNGTFDLRIRVL